MGKLTMTLLAAFCIASQLSARPSTSAPASGTVIEPTCADLMAALRVADPGVKPSRKREADAQEAQDDIATALFWLHGWNVAKGRASLPVTRTWMTRELKRVTEACRATSPDGTALISKVATR